VAKPFVPSAWRFVTERQIMIGRPTRIRVIGIAHPVKGRACVLSVSRSGRGLSKGPLSSQGDRSALQRHLLGSHEWFRPAFWFCPRRFPIL